MTEFHTLRQLLSSARTAEALAQLAAWSQTQNPIWRQAALLLQASWANNEQQAQRGLLAYDEAERVRNRITAGALGLIDEIESGATAPKAVLEGLQREFLSEPVAAVLQGGHTTQLSGSQVHVQGSREVVIGSGNTITKKTIAGLGRAQFAGIVVGLLVLFGGGYWAFGLLTNSQAAAYVSLREIQKELTLRGNLDKDVRQRVEKNRTEIDAWLAEGMSALKRKDYAEAVPYLEKVAAEAPLATVRQNLAFAYEQLGNAEKARENLEQAKKINPFLVTQKTAAALKGKRINLLAPENGRTLKTADEASIDQLVDGSDRGFHQKGGVWAVWGFKDGRKARFDEVGYFVPSSSHWHIDKFVLSYGNAPQGPFTLIDTFNLFKGLITDQPYQSFKFPRVSAPFVRFEVPDGCGAAGCNLYELQLMGTLE